MSQTEYKYIKKFNLDFEFGTLLYIDFNFNFESPTSLNLIDEIMSEIDNYLEFKDNPDYFWFKGIKTHLEHSKCKKIVKKIKKKYPHQKIGMNLNCSLLQNEKQRKDYYNYDLIAISLNSVESINFSKINNCSNKVDSRKVLDGIKQFRKKFDGIIGIYTLFINGMNDTLENIEKLKIFLLETLPDHFSVSNYTLDGYEPVSETFMNKVKDSFRYVPFKVIYTF